MKNILYAALGLLLLTGSCKKDQDAETCNITVASAPAQETENLQQYLDDNSIVAERHEKGFFYVIHEPGSGKQPDACSDIRVNYIGRLKNGNIFDQANNTSFGLSGLIPGWQAGIPLIRTGGRITLYLPPSHGYGSKGSSSVPPHAVIIFSVDLLEVK